MFFDAHAHVNFAAFQTDWQAVMDRALALDLCIINVGTQKDTSRRAVEIARSYPNAVYASVGLHPVHTESSFYDAKELAPSSESQAGAPSPAVGFRSRAEQFDYEYYRDLARDPKVLTIGECGLDYYRLSEGTHQRQKAAFEQQIALAREVGKPLMIHCREAFDDLIEILIGRSHLLQPRSAGIVHFFTGTRKHAQALLDLGFSFTFGGVITFLRDYDDVIKMLPLDRILSETDAPYVTPVPYRDRRNEPAFVVEVLRKLAAIRGVSVDAMKEEIWRNAQRLFTVLATENG